MLVIYQAGSIIDPGRLNLDLVALTSHPLTLTGKGRGEGIRIPISSFRINILTALKTTFLICDNLFSTPDNLFSHRLFPDFNQNEAANVLDCCQTNQAVCGVK